MKKHILLASAVVVLTAAAVAFSVFQARRIEREAGVEIPKAVTTEAGAQKKRQLSPANPADYGMVVFDENSKPRSQGDWDRMISQKTAEIKESYSKEVWDKAREKKKEDPERTVEKLWQIDAEIKKCQAVLTKDPGNQEMQEKLERMMMLKAIAKEFKP